MATFEIPAEPATDRVWLLDHPTLGGPLLFTRVGTADGWERTAPNGDRLMHYYWAELLAEGVVTDVDPDDVSWLPPGPWTASGPSVRDSNDYSVLDIEADLSTEDDIRLASLVARLVNEHVARRIAGGA